MSPKGGKSRFKSRTPQTTQKSIESTFRGTVRDLASDGRGIVIHLSGLAVFVGGVWPGEEGEFRLLEKKSRFANGELLKLETSSPERVTPFCMHHGFDEKSCGACPWQFIDYSAQLRAKQQRVETELSKICRCTVKPIAASPITRGYRNRAQLKTDGKVIGYHSFNRNTLAAIADCPILSEHNRKTLAELIDRLPNPQWRSGKKGSAKGNPKTKNQHTTLHIDESVDAASVGVNRRLLFRQSHDAQNQLMKDWLLRGLQKIGSGQKILELFCGSGNFTEAIATSHPEYLLAVDGVREATAGLNDLNLPAVEVLTLDLFSEAVYTQIYARRKIFTTLVLDPPRSGLQNTQGLIQKKHTFEHVFYISCDLATFCRDIKFFRENGFELMEVQPVDTVPHTPHVELLAYLQLR